MSVCYVAGGASGGIEKVVDHGGKAWFDARASSVAARLKTAGWSKLDCVNRWKTLNENTPWVNYSGCIDTGKTTH